ncbi:uncharacterized protein LOC126908511 isoform X6 [Daktulosphaira vitifoliae]|uniref:uncharacterized protein LOC126908511 isoform X6 n=1 Tax=Daktulosphaira vitifoliae TaxID=58002 RepID=UPI0021AA85B1|nr:uncharacterized protein LOC126908511 isoform X6 [Daktulosphaira vitifoliae]XP_050546616.1 uncharacterized protein LOC126908511 isoform X6 [Daktulosphaira vitifoliae]XP_050546617.1 uncharacterized protein LOC126908511 isoform X6 [Daktulosphaira vitifoliae]
MTSLDSEIIECSDDENYGFKKNQVNNWYPDPIDIYSLYNSLDSGNISSLKLDWTCPGRRELTPENTQVSHNTINEECEITESIDQSDFDFEDEMSNMNLTRLEGKKELKGSAKKKTTSLDAVLSNMVRHQKMDNMLDEKFDSL